MPPEAVTDATIAGAAIEVEVPESDAETALEEDSMTRDERVQAIVEANAEGSEASEIRR